MGYKDIDREYFLSSLKTKSFLTNPADTFIILMNYANKMTGFTDESKIWDLLAKIVSSPPYKRAMLETILSKIIQDAISYLQSKFNILTLLDKNGKVLLYY